MNKMSSLVAGFFIFPLLLISPFLTCEVNAQLPVNPSSDNVYLYEHTNYEGARLVLNTSNYSEVSDLRKWSPYSGKTWNDMISSLKVGSNARVFLYKDINFKGYMGNFEGTNSTANLHQSGKGDVISSIKIVTKPSAEPACDEVYFYEHADFKGELIIFSIPEGANDLSYYKFPWNTGKGWNDAISSIKVGRNAKVYVYKDINSQGYLTAYWGNGKDVRKVSSLALYNDVISSFSIVNSPEANWSYW